MHIPFNTDLGTWQAAVDAQLDAPSAHELLQILASSKEYYPAPDCVFRALKLTPLDSVKVVILGQDPYHGPNQANGLAFAVNQGQRLPPSLRNIFKQLAAEYPGFHVQQDENDESSGRLIGWAQQGILLLNTSLTVLPGKAGSHSGIGWQRITSGLIETVSDTHEHVVFVLWGAHAQARSSLIDPRHTIIATAHPSPLSAYRGFFGSDCFTRVNAALAAHGQTPIQWERTLSAPEI